MGKIAVVYWSGTGNTETMAKSVAEGIKEAGEDVQLYEATDFSVALIKEYEKVAFGCPSMGDEVLEETEFEPMFNSIESELKGKKVVLFGSYGWGDGEWMRNWTDTVKSDGAILAAESVIACEEPDDEATDACQQLGRALVEA